MALAVSAGAGASAGVLALSLGANGWPAAAASRWPAACAFGALGALDAGPRAGAWRRRALSVAARAVARSRRAAALAGLACGPWAAPAARAVPGPLRCAGYGLQDLRFVGSGAHGVVYADSALSLVAKFSYQNTAGVVREECETLRRLEAAAVPFVERCRGTCQVDGGVVALYAPFFDGAQQASPTVVAGLTSEAKRAFVTASTAFLVRCLAAGVAVNDLQVLVRPTGDVLAIDLTGAGPVAGGLGLARAQQSLSEWAAVLPADVQAAAAESLAAELGRLPRGSLPSNAAEAVADAPLAVPEPLLARLAEAAAAAAAP